MAVKYDASEMHVHLGLYAMNNGWTDTGNALSFARKAHEGQFRSGGEPYIVHPLTVACHALALGIKEDAVIATAILHDVVEDCGIEVEALPVSAEVREAVRVLTHIKGQSYEDYYQGIKRNRIALLVKILDRCNNVSTMAGAFPAKKIKHYIAKTRECILPLIQKGKKRYPDDFNVLFALEYHIVAVIDGVEAYIKVEQ